MITRAEADEIRRLATEWCWASVDFYGFGTEGNLHEKARTHEALSRRLSELTAPDQPPPPALSRTE